MEVEWVLVVPRERFEKLGAFQGFRPASDRDLPPLLDPQWTRYLPRDAMERDPSYKQLIPYVIFRYRGEGGDELFHYTRGRGQGEARLHALRSIGVGGHISSLDAGSAPPYWVGLQRELDEEVIIDAPHELRCIGMLNDDANEVGRVHLGIVHVCEVAAPAVAPRESELLGAGFSPLEELSRDLAEFETWSQFCLRALQLETQVAR